MTFEKVSHEPTSRECAACRMQTPVERVDCIHCGYRSPEAEAAEQEAEKANRFIQALIVRSSPFAFLLIGANLAFFVLEWLAGGMSSMSADISVLRAIGAKDASLIDEQREYWRFVTAIFIHIGYLHFLFNNYALWIIGQEIERIYGSARFVILYLATGLVSTAASYYFTPNTLSAGASGSIFGLFGVMAAFAFKYRKELPKFLSADIKRRIIPVILINLAFGFSVRIVDNSAHIGGLVAGIVLAFIIPYKRIDEGKTSAIWRALQVISLAVILVSFAAAFRNYDGPKLSLDNLTATPGAKVSNYYNGVTTASSLISRSINSMATILNSKNSSGDTRSAREDVEQAIRALNSVPSINQQTDKYPDWLRSMAAKERDVIERFSNTSPKQFNKTIGEMNEIHSDYKKFREEFDPWVKDFIKESGFEIHETESGK